MANRDYKPLRGSLDREVVKLYARLTVGASGAVTAGTGNGITSFTKEAADGTYTITLDDYYNALLCVHAINLAATEEDLIVQVTDDSVTSGTLQVAFNTAGTLADPTSGDIILFEITLRNSSLTK